MRRIVRYTREHQPSAEELRRALVRSVRKLLYPAPARQRAQNVTRAWLDDVWERRAKREDFMNRREAHRRKFCRRPGCRAKRAEPPAPGWKYEAYLRHDAKSGNKRLVIGLWTPPELSLTACPDDSSPLPLLNRGLTLQEKYAIALAIHRSAAVATNRLDPSPGGRAITVDRWVAKLPAGRKSFVEPFMKGSETVPFRELVRLASALPRNPDEAETLNELIAEVGEDLCASGATPVKMTAASPPLSDIEQRVFDCIKASHPKGVTGKQICKVLRPLEQATLTRHIIPKLKLHGIRNRRGVGYYVGRA